MNSLETLIPSEGSPAAVAKGLTSLDDFSDAAWHEILASTLHHAEAGHQWTDRHRNRSLGLVFMNPSLRTRSSMEVAARQLGASVTTLQPGQGMWQLSVEDGVPMLGPEAEHVTDAAAVLSQYFDTIGLRTFAGMTDYEADRTDRVFDSFVSAASVPVINLESAWRHPCQSVADAAVLLSRFGEEVRERRFVLSWTYHPKALPMAVANSTVQMAARLGMDVTVVRPESHALDAGVMQSATSLAKSNGGRIKETSSWEAFEGTHVVYAKSWGGRMAYTDPDGETRQRDSLRNWRITAEIMSMGLDPVFMHCLPVRRNVVVDDEVLDGPSSLHIRQAAFRLWAQKAILDDLWTDA